MVKINKVLKKIPVMRKLKKALNTTADSKGFIFGQVTPKDAEIYIWDITTGDGSFLIDPNDESYAKTGNIYTVRTDDDGFYGFAFTWSGSQIASDISAVTANIAVVHPDFPVYRTIINERLQIRAITDLRGINLAKPGIASQISRIIASQKRIMLIGYRNFNLINWTFDPKI